MSSDLAPSSPPDPLGDRVARLLLRFEEMKRTIALQNNQIEHLRSERDMLESRLKLASERIGGLIEHFPPAAPT